MKEKLLSRKLIITILGVAYLTLTGDTESAKWLLFAYVGAQGIADSGMLTKHIK